MVTPKQISPATTFGRSLLNLASQSELQSLVGSTPPGARVTRTSSASIANNTSTALIFDSVRWNQGAVFLFGQPTRLTAPSAGVYAIGGHVRFDANGTGARSAFIRLNGTTLLAVSSAAAASTIDYSVASCQSLAAGDYIELLVFQDSGAALNLQVAGSHSPEFWMQKVDGPTPTVAAPTFRTYNNENYSIPADTDYLDQIGTVTARRTLTLPPLPSPGSGPLTITDTTLSSLKYGTIVAPNGSDLINGRSASIVLNPDHAATVFYPCSTGWIATGIPWSQNGMDAGAHDAVFSSFTQGLAGFGVSNSGGSIGNLATNDVNRVGILELTTGTGTTGRSALTSLTESIILLSTRNYLYKTAVQIPVASDSSNPYIIRVGFNNSSSGDGANGIYFRYSHSLNSGFWQCVCRAGSLETAANTLIAPAFGGSYQELSIWVNASTGLVEFFINNLSVGSILSNVPLNATNRATTLAMSIVKDGAGSTSRVFRTDYVYFRSY